MTHTPFQEDIVSTTTSGDQYAQGMLALDDGGWVVVWSSDGQDGSDSGVYQQVFNADGSARGGETRINTYTSGNQNFNSITALSDGGWVVAFESEGQDGDDLGIFQQRFDVNGEAVGDEQQVSTSAEGRQFRSETALLDDGGWVVTWTSWNSDFDDAEIYQQRYDADGATVGGEIRVNTYTTSWQADSHIAALPDGGWVVIWRSNGQDGSNSGVYQQVYDGDGNTVGDETRVNTYTSGNQGGNPWLTVLADGGWVVNWASDDQDGSGDGVYQQRYDASGVAVGDETQVNTYSTDSQYLSGAKTCLLASGGWVVTWASTSQDDGSFGVYQQIYDADGNTVGDETRVNSYSAGFQFPQTVIALAEGGWVQLWTSGGQDGDSNGIYQQAFNADGTPMGEETRVNTTTEGSQGRPVATALADGGWIVSWFSDASGDYDVLQQRYDASGQVYGSNHAPTAADITIDSLANGTYTFSEATFGFSDGDDGDSLASVVITALPAAGKLLLNGVAVTADQEISAAELGNLVWKPGKTVPAAEIEFKLVDDGGTEAGGRDTSEAFTLTFDILSNTVTGTKKADRLTGTDIHDLMMGKRGDDRLTGGDADDWFIFRAGDGKDTITDFGIDEGDRVVLSFLDDITSWKDLAGNHFEQHGRNLWITSETGTTIVLRNIDADDLGRGDFLF